MLLRSIHCGPSDAIFSGWGALAAPTLDFVASRNAPCHSDGQLLDRRRNLSLRPLTSRNPQRLLPGLPRGRVSPGGNNMKKVHVVGGVLSLLLCGALMVAAQQDK